MKFVRNSYEIRTNFCEFRPVSSFCCCVVPCLFPHSQWTPCTLLPVCRSRSTRGRRTFGTTPGAGSSPGPDCPRSTASRPEAPVVDGPRGRPAVGVVRARGALDVLQGAAARPATVRGMRRMRWSSPCRPARTWAPPTPSPPWTGSPWPQGNRIRPGRSRCRPGLMGGTGISLPCGTWSWSPGGCGARSASPSPAPLWSWGDPS